MKIVFTCGGTGGHINPAIAVAKLVKERNPSADILFLGADGGMEESLVKREGLNIETVPVSNFRRSLKPKDIKNNVGTLFGILRSVRRSKSLLSSFGPDVVVGTGGYASFPTVYAASLLKIPTAIHESNAIPGLTTSLLSRRADKIMVGFEGGKNEYKHPDRVVYTGTPVREDFIFTKKADAKKQLGYEGMPLVVSYWGSLGAREMNKKIAAFMAAEVAAPAEFFHIHATGSFGWKWMPNHLKELGIDLLSHPNIDMREYIYDMPTVMAAADLIICRGGASTLSEVLASGTPAIVVPSPNVAENHQEKNARALEKTGGAIVVLEKACNGKDLFDLTRELLGDVNKLEKMSEKLKETSVLDSADKIYSVVIGLVRN